MRIEERSAPAVHNVYGTHYHHYSHRHSADDQAHAGHEVRRANSHCATF